MRTAALGEVAQIVSGATPKTGTAEFWDGDVDWATPADLSKLDGPYISATPRKITQAGVRSCATTILPAGSVLLSSRAPIGHVAVNTVPMATNQGFKSLVPGPNLDAKYLFHWLKSKTEYLQSLGNGATFKELSKKTAEQIQVPLPPLPEQRRIAAILDYADTLRAKRRQVLTHLDSLTQAIFNAMFGAGNYPSQRLDELIDHGDRMNYGVVQPGDETPGGVALIRVSDLAGGIVDRANLKHISPDIEASYVRSRLRGNEILVSSVGSIGAVSLVGPTDVGSNIARAITRVPISDEWLRTYVAAYLRTPTPQRYFVAELRTVAQPTLNVGQLAATQVPVPPVNLQIAFGLRIRSVQDHTQAVLRACDSDDELFVSLQSRAFRGEL